MTVINRQTTIERLKAGEKMRQSIWGGYHYSIGKGTVRFETARWLMREGLVKVVDKEPGLITWFIWAGGVKHE